MPTYSFSCPHCGHTFDRIMGMNDPKPTTCSSCQQPVNRVFYAPAVHYVAPGFSKPRAIERGQREAWQKKNNAEYTD